MHSRIHSLPAVSPAPLSKRVDRTSTETSPETSAASRRPARHGGHRGAPPRAEVHATTQAQDMRPLHSQDGALGSLTSRLPANRVTKTHCPRGKLPRTNQILMPLKVALLNSGRQRCLRAIPLGQYCPALIQASKADPIGASTDGSDMVRPSMQYRRFRWHPPTVASSPSLCLGARGGGLLHGRFSRCPDEHDPARLRKPFPRCRRHAVAHPASQPLLPNG